MTIGGTNATSVDIGRAGMLTTIKGDFEVEGASTLIGAATLDGDVSLGDGSGDTVTVGGGGDTVYYGTTGDTQTLRADLGVNNAVDIRMDRVTGAGVLVLPSTSAGEVGAVRVNASNEFQWWDGAAWTTAGSSAGNTLQQAYDAGQIITTSAAGGDLEFVPTTNGNITITNGTDQFDFNFTAAQQLSIDADLQNFDLDVAGTITMDGALSIGQTTAAAGLLDFTTLDIDATGALTIDSTGGAISIGADANANAINIGTGAAARTITLGNAASTEIQLDAILVDINGGAGGVTIDGAAASNVTTSAGALTLTSAAAATWSTVAGALTLTSAAAATWSTAAGILTIIGDDGLVLDSTDGEITLDDVNRATSTYSAAMKFSETAAEWSTFETNFGEVSLLNAMSQAHSAGAGFSATTTAGVTAGYAVGGSTTADEVDHADADSANPETALCLGFAQATVGAGLSAVLLTSGLMTVTSNAAEDWTAGDMIYLDVNAGLVSSTAPSGAGDTVQCVGYCAGDDGGASLTHSMWIQLTLPTYI